MSVPAGFSDRLVTTFFSRWSSTATSIRRAPRTKRQFSAHPTQSESPAKARGARALSSEIEGSERPLGL